MRRTSSSGTKKPGARVESTHQTRFRRVGRLPHSQSPNCHRALPGSRAMFYVALSRLTKSDPYPRLCTSTLPQHLKQRVTQTTCVLRLTVVSLALRERFAFVCDCLAHPGLEYLMSLSSPFDDLIGLSETARLAGLSESGLKGRAARGAFPPPLRVSGRRAWLRCEVMSWLQTHHPPANAPAVCAEEASNG